MKIHLNFSQNPALILGSITARIERFKIPSESPIKVPHMGWNDVVTKKQHPIMNGIEQDSRFYFVHSFHAVCAHEENELLETTHGYPFTAAFTRETGFTQTTKSPSTTLQMNDNSFQHYSFLANS